MRADEFLDMYRELEDLLESKYAGKKMHYSSVIFEYLNDYDSKPVRDKLDVCREIRNLLTHTAKVGGQEVIEPSEPICNELRKCIEYVKRPPLAMDFATKGENIMRAGLNQSVLKIMRNMDKNGYSHVPIMENGSFVGVFSLGTVFNYVLNSQGKAIGPNTTIAELRDYLPIKAHSENYQFVPKSTTLSRVRSMFENVKARNRRLAVIFITENGSEDERLLGMLTPWDVLGEK